MIPISHLICNRRPLDESGFALITAIIILVIITALTGTAITVAVQSSTSTARDNNVKAELAAAEAGLQVASYRLTQLKPTETQCINESAAVTSTLAEVESKCKDSAESLGNGAKFQYWTTLPLKAGNKCAGRTIEAVAGVTQRCVSSEGKVNGALPGVRLQVNVKAAAPESLFGVPGIVGLNKVFANGNVKLGSVVASNGEITDGGKGSPHYNAGFELCPPNGKFVPAAGAARKKFGGTIGPTEKEKEYAALEKTRSAPECPIKAPLPSIHATAASNEDSRIGAADKLVGGSWISAKYELTLEGVAKLTLGEAGRTTKYFFCSFRMPGGGPELKVAAGAHVEIFIGDPSEGTCAAGTGKFEIAGGSKTETESKNPAALLIVMGGAGPFSFTNGSGKTLEASIYAPNAQVHIEGGVKFKGGIVGSEVFLEGGSEAFEWSAETGSLTNGNPTGYARKGWAQCAPGTGGSETC